MEQNPYKVLGVSETATDEEIKKAYRELVKKYHPDKYADNPLADVAAEKMKEINAAYEQITKDRKAGRTGGYSQQSYGGYGNSTYGGQNYGGYGAGYGDFPIECAPLLIASVDAVRKIGVCCTATHMLTPRKTIIGVIGLFRGELDKKRRSCEDCSLKETCKFRAYGTRC